MCRGQLSPTSAGRPLGAAIFRSEAFMWLNDGSLQSISNAFQMAAQQARRLGPTPGTSQSYSASPSWVPITCPSLSMAPTT